MNTYCRLFIVFTILSFVEANSKSEQCKEVKQSKDKPDYCQEPIQPHLGCNKTEEWGKECGSKPRLYQLNAKARIFLKRQHNVYRNTIARGVLRELPTAARMLKLKWDNNLAHLAELAARQCSIEPITDSYSTPDHSTPGYLAVYNKVPKDEPQNQHKILSAQLKSWYDQYQHMTVERLQDEKPKEPEVSHFLQIAYGLNDRFGCGVSVYEKGPWKYHLLICLYGCNRKPGKSTYLFGRVPGEKCECGSDLRFKNLCAEKETVGDCGLLEGDPNDDYDDEMENNVPTTTRRPKPTKPSKSNQFDPIGSILSWIKDKVDTMHENHNLVIISKKKKRN